jgi:hypothetical protein
MMMLMVIMKIPMVVTLVGMITDVKLVHEVKALFPLIFKNETIK